MKRLGVLIVGALLVQTSVWAELQNVEVGGKIRVRWRHWDYAYADDSRGEIRIPGNFLPRRPIGDERGVVSVFNWDDKGNDLDFTEILTLLSVKADFTDHVAAQIELESYDIFGEDFRSDYITGADSRANTNDDVEVVQAYIEADELYGTPLRLRVGRQKMEFGKGWIVGATASSGRSQPFDALRLTYSSDILDVDAWASVLAEGGVGEQDGDVDFYGVYATLKPIEPLSVSAYWLFVRDARSISDTNFVAPIEWLENWLGRDDYDPTTLHTVGTRLFGKAGNFDYDLELAYQFGEADAVGALFRPIGFNYGDDGAEFSAWGGDVEVGYSMELWWLRRAYIGGAYFGGEDNRDVDFFEWLLGTGSPDASVSFNRVFPSYTYTEILDRPRNMSNVWQARAGVELQATETISAKLELAYYEALEPFDMPAYVTFGDFRVPLAPALSFWTQEGGDEIGFMSTLQVTYDYTEDLMFRATWQHLFSGDGTQDGAFITNNGLSSIMGTDDADADYFSLEAVLKF
ncbi:MAG: alginate export family protein [Candidatus Hydrogenedentes bacterium]|nr:alginate export family protein [Candidatus Hydrogenedentota bacterium]